MSLLGPIVVVSELPGNELPEALSSAGAFPVMEVNAAEAVPAITTINPSAVIMADAELIERGDTSRILKAIALGTSSPYTPLVVSFGTNGETLAPWMLPISSTAPTPALIARLKAATRVRVLHAKVLRRVREFGAGLDQITTLLDSDPLSDATMLVVGRGRDYPALSVAIGERVGLIGTLSLDAAMAHLHERDIDGVVIGEGFERSLADDFLQTIGADPRFRDLPVGSFDAALVIAPERLPNFERLSGDPRQAITRMIPLVRQYAFAARLKRMSATLDQHGMIDPQTGLLTRDAFRRDLDRAIDESHESGGSLAVARFTLDRADQRTSIDAARIVSRLVRTTDFATQDEDGGILVALAESDVASARAVAKRISGVLKHTTLRLGENRAGFDPSVALTAAEADDAADALLARLKRTVAGD